MAFNTFSFLISLILTIILTPLNALILNITTKWFKLENTNYRTAFKVMSILALLWLVMITIISFIPSLTIVIYIIFSIISIILAFWLIQTNYNTDAGKTILILIVVGIISPIVSVTLITVLTILAGIIGLGILFGS